MRSVLVPLAAIALLCLGSLAQADVFNLGTGLKNLETVFVGDAGNAADWRALDYGTSVYGSVAYTYNIGKYEVTAAQYCDFLNHKAKESDPYGLYNSNMWSDSLGCKIQRSGGAGNYSYSVSSEYANRPVNFVSFWDACRFANWLAGGQGNGDTETGAYTLGGYNGMDGRNIHRNASYTWAVTSEDEWYKAAYYKGGGNNAGYWYFPTQSDLIDASTANIGNVVGHPTNVGAYASPSAYGTYDQGGNVYEWNESIPYVEPGWTARGARGGCYYQSGDPIIGPIPYPWYFNAVSEASFSGFRVSAVPEPPSITALLGGLGLFRAGLLRRRTNLLCVGSFFGAETP